MASLISGTEIELLTSSSFISSNISAISSNLEVVLEFSDSSFSSVEYSNGSPSVFTTTSLSGSLG